MNKIVFTLSGIFTLLILIVIVAYILIKGMGVINLEFLLTSPRDSGKTGGILPMIVSSFYLLLITALISLPIGIGSAIYIEEYSKSSYLSRFITFTSQILASVPSIIYGLFGLAFLVFFLKLGWSILSGGIVLALMSIPTIFQVSQVSIASVPNIYREGSYALGATKWQCITSVILPYALSGIFTGVILAITRAFSEAAAVMFVVGSSINMPISIFDAGRPLPLHLYILASEGISMDNAYGTAAVLVIIILAITLITNFIINRYRNRVMGV